MLVNWPFRLLLRYFFCPEEPASEETVDLEDY